MKRALSCLLCALAVIAALSVPRPAKALDELKNTDPDKYYILLDLRNQIVTVYERDEAGGVYPYRPPFPVHHRPHRA